MYASDWKGGHSAEWLRFIKHPDEPYKTTLPELQAYVDAVLALRGVQSRFGQRRVAVMSGQGRRRAAGSYGYIKLPLWARDESTVIHELAHSLNPTNDLHGPTYAGTFVLLVRLIVSPGAARELRDSFRKNRVRVSFKNLPKPRVSRVVTQKARIEKKRARDDAPVSREALNETARILRKLIRFGRFGPTGRKPRVHASAVARAIEVLAESHAWVGRLTEKEAE